MKKIISILLIVTMIFAMAAAVIPASAQETFDPATVGNNVVNSSNRASYVSTLPAGAIAIGSKDALKGIQGGKYYYLTADITLGSGESAGSGAELTGVTLDGCGYTVTINNCPLFGKSKNLTVKNLTIDGTVSANDNANYYAINKTGSSGYTNIENVTASVDFTVTNTTDNRKVGALCADVSSSSVKNVLNEGSVTIKKATKKIGSIGAMFGSATGTSFENVVNKGTLTLETLSISSTLSIAGVVGYAKNSTFKNCVNSAAITSSAKSGEVYIGGIVAYSDTYTKFENCSNSGAITIGAGGKVTALGGIMAMVSGDGADFYNCSNGGVIKMSPASGNLSAAVTGEPKDIGMGIAGILGVSRAKNIHIEDSTNTKAISVIASGTVGAGGILGYQYCTEAVAETLSIEDCSNSGAISDSGNGAMLGGIVGAIRGETDTVIQNTVNTGAITVPGGDLAWRAAGGICGFFGTVGGVLSGGNRNLESALDFYCCTNKGTISNTGHAGGILGHSDEMASEVIVMTFYGCVNEGAVTSSDGNAAGMYGNPISKAFLVVNCCENKAAIKGNDAGGIISTPSNTFSGIKIMNAKNSGNITGAHNAGGIATKASQERWDVSFENCLNTGKVHAESRNYGLSGGIVSYSKTEVNLKNCVNSGTISSVLKDSAYPITHNLTNVVDGKGNVYLKGCVTATSITVGTAKTSAQISEITKKMSFQCANNPYNLTKAYARANKYYPQDHTEESWAPLGEAIDAAKLLLEDPVAKQEDMDKVVADIYAGINGLVKTGLQDFSGLEQAIADGEAAGEEWYTLTWLELFKAIRDANLILKMSDEEKAKLLQSDIDKASARIYKAIDELLEKPPIQGEIDVEANGDFTVDTLRPTSTTSTTSTTASSETLEEEESEEEEEVEEEGDKPLLNMNGAANFNCNAIIGGGAVALTAIIAIATGVALKKKED